MYCVACISVAASLMNSEDGLVFSALNSSEFSIITIFQITYNYRHVDPGPESATAKAIGKKWTALQVGVHVYIFITAMKRYIHISAVDRYYDIAATHWTHFESFRL